jgi:hypothetical protein
MINEANLNIYYIRTFVSFYNGNLFLKLALINMSQNI